MTDERAMEILDPEHREHYDSIEPVNEACLIGIEAIRERINRNSAAGQNAGDGWVSVKDRLPESEQDVLISVERRMAYSDPPGKKCRFVAKAFYEDGTMNTDDSLYTWNEICSSWEYIESKDAYRIPGGWFESVDYEDEFNAVDDFVTHWMPLPEPPKEHTP